MDRTTRPHTRQKYTDWLIRTYIKNGIEHIEHIEDIPARLTKALRLHNKLSKSGKIDNKYKNIDIFKNITNLEDFIEYYYRNDVTDKEIDDKGKELLKNDEAELVYNGPDYRVVMPKTHKAS